jgi:uncharacterized protein (TIGR03437 family)
VLQNGTWTNVYTLQAGLNLGQPYTVPNYPTTVGGTTITPATGGLRNIAGKINGDGTVTIYAITSTDSGNGDQGADPNMVVAITDTIAATTLPASEKFSVFVPPVAGVVVRGVSLTPTLPTLGPAPANVPLILSAASVSASSIAPGSVATANGQALATTTFTPSAPFPTSAAGVTVSILDAAGNTTNAPLVSVSPAQVTFIVPATVATGTAQINVNSGGVTQTANNIEISYVAPGLLILNGNGLAAGDVVQVAAGGAQTVQQIYTTNSAGGVVPVPIVLGGGNTTVLRLYGTGIAGAGTALTSATVNGTSVTVTYAGPAGADTGLDEVNILLPASLAGKGNVNVQVTAGGVAANPVQITIM